MLIEQASEGVFGPTVWSSECARRSPDVPERAPERCGQNRRNRAERHSPPRGMVEGMLLSSKLLSIGRLAEFPAGNISLRIAGIEIIPSDGRSHRGRALLPAYTSPMLQEPAQPAHWAQRDSGCPRDASAEAGSGPLLGRSRRVGPRNRPTGGANLERRVFSDTQITAYRIAA